MTFIDNYGMKYKTIKKDNNYYLITTHSNCNKRPKFCKVEVKGKQNILTYIKNNKLVRCEG